MIADEITARAIYKTGLPSPLLVQERLGLVRSWLKDCLTEHSHCSSASSKVPHVKPTRLIDLGCVNNSHAPSPRLVDTAMLDPSVPVEYTALSHCWSRSPCSEAMTTRANEAMRRQHISFSSLPKTYRDAMIVTRALGVRFVWIDSLCIIQGDKVDWAAEAAIMSSVFQGCILVLAAASSPDADGGCFLDSFKQPKHIKYLSKGQEARIEIRDVSLGHSFDPLDTRAWVLQETLLAPRIVYFSKNQFYWQCQTYTHSEDGIIRDSPDYRLHKDPCFKRLDFSNKMVARDHWWAWVTNYTSRKLSQESDYVAAFAGITQYFATRTGVEPALGLWADKMFAFDLGWSTYDLIGLSLPEDGLRIDRIVVRSVMRNMPSWSWFRYQMPVFGHLLSASEGVAVTRLVDFDIKWAGSPLTSDVVSSRLLLSGLVTVLELVPSSTPKRWQFCSFTQTHLSCFLDEDSSLTQDEKASITAPCLLLSMQPKQLFGVFLVLEEVASDRSDRKTYRRIGVSHFPVSLVSLHPFHNAKRVFLELV